MTTAALPGPRIDANDTVLKWSAFSKHKDGGSATPTDENSSSSVMEDDMILGAEAGHLDEGRLKTLSQCICKGKITHMDSVSSDGSRYSIDQLLQDRKPDPEEMLRNLGFTAGSKTKSRRCVPARFLQNPSRAKGICLEQLIRTNPQLKECIEASSELMMPQGSGGHTTAISFKTVTKTMRMLTRFSQMHKTAPQETSAPKNHIEPVQITSPDGYKYMTILDPENARYLDRQGHYKLSRRQRCNKLPDIPSPTSSPDQKLLREVDKTPLKPAAICNEKDGKHESNDGKGGGEKAVTLRRQLDLVESNKENINLNVDLNANLQPQPVPQSPWQPAGFLTRPIAQNHGAVLIHFLQRSLSLKHDQSEHTNTDAASAQINSTDGDHSLTEQQCCDIDRNIATERLDTNGASLEIRMGEQPSADHSNDYLSDDSVGEHGTDEQRLRWASIEGDGSDSSNADIDQSDVFHREDDAVTRRGAGVGSSKHSVEATSVPKEGREIPREGSGSTVTSDDTKEKQLQYRRAKWHRSTNFTIQVEPEEAVAGEGLNPLATYSPDQDDTRRVPLLHDDGSQQPSFEKEVQSGDEDVVDESLPFFKRATSQGSLVRTGSGQSDSSGFIEFDEESEMTASFARISSKDSVKENHAGSIDSSCTICGSLDHNMWLSLEHDGRSSPEHDGQYAVECNQCSLQNSDLTQNSSSSFLAVQDLDSAKTSKIVAMTTSDHHDNTTRSSAIIGTELQRVTSHDGHVESKGAVSANVSSDNTSEASITIKDQLPLSSLTQTLVTVNDTSPCHECRQEPKSCVTDSLAVVEVDSVEGLRLTPHPSSGPEAATVIHLPGVGDGDSVHGQDMIEETQHLKVEVRQSPQHLEEEARQAQQQHLVEEVKQVQQAVVRYKSSLQVLESRSTEIMSTHISEQFRDEQCELQQLRSDIFQEVVKLEHLLAVRMRLVIAGAGIQLHASHTNHEHIVMPMIELLKEQTYHRSVVDTTVSQQSMTQSLDSSDIMVDTTVDDMNLMQHRQSDNVLPHQMMFIHAMDELKVSLLADIRNTIRSEMEPLRLQMQEFGDRLKKLESAVTSSQLVAPPADTQHDNGVT